MRADFHRVPRHAVAAEHVPQHETVFGSGEQTNRRIRRVRGRGDHRDGVHFAAVALRGLIGIDMVNEGQWKCSILHQIQFQTVDTYQNPKTWYPQNRLLAACAVSESLFMSPHPEGGNMHSEILKKQRLPRSSATGSRITVVERHRVYRMEKQKKQKNQKKVKTKEKKLTRATRR